MMRVTTTSMKTKRNKCYNIAKAAKNQLILGRKQQLIVKLVTCTGVTMMTAGQQQVVFVLIAVSLSVMTAKNFKFDHVINALKFIAQNVEVLSQEEGERSCVPVVNQGG